MFLLFHPRVTLAATILGFASIGALCASIIGSLAPLETVHGLEAARPALEHVTLVLGVVAAICNAIAGVGRSFAPMIDKPKSPPPSV